MLSIMQSAYISHSCCWLQVCFDVVAGLMECCLDKSVAIILSPILTEPFSTAPTSQCTKQRIPDADP